MNTPCENCGSIHCNPPTGECPCREPLTFKQLAGLLFVTAVITVAACYIAFQIGRWIA